MASAAALLAGVVCAQALPELPPQWPMLALAAAAALGSWRFPRVRVLLLFVLGFGWACWRGGEALALRLPAALEGQDLLVSGRVVDLPRTYPGSVRFDFIPTSAIQGQEPVSLSGTLRLSQYGADSPPRPGQELELVVRLKRPRGVVNPGGFDFERFALERRIAATGYVREARSARGPGWHGAVDRLRADFSAEIATRLGATSAAALLRALAVGDQSALSERNWAVLRATGTAHLIAISGFHIGVVAGFGALLGRMLFRFLPGLALRTPRPRIEAVLALAFAVLYSLLAGFSLPVQRTLLMIAVVLVALWSRRVLAPGGAFALALMALLLVDPLAVLGAGFWLSFLGVAWLIYCLGGRHAREPVLHQFGRAQWAMALGLLPLTVWFFQQSAVIGPLANLVAVPWISLVVVPLLLVALLGWLVAPALIAVPLAFARVAVSGIDRLLEFLADLPWAQVFLPEPGIAVLLLALLGSAVLLLPRAVPGRALGVFLLLPLVWPRAAGPSARQFELTAIDVGQGLAVLVRTAGHSLLYDTGPGFAGGFDMGDAAVVPALRAMGLAGIDGLVVSHDDNDHDGGAESVRLAMPPKTLSLGGPRTGAAQPCTAGTSWTWDGVRFEILHPPPAFPDLDNDSSCVLRVASGRASALLPGDISEAVESRLLRESGPGLRATVLIAPHHGSRSSSSEAFVRAVAPEHVVFSSGYRNRFGHPARDVVERYRNAGVEMHDTAGSGAIRLLLAPDGTIRSLRSHRVAHPRYWREPATAVVVPP